MIYIEPHTFLVLLLNRRKTTGFTKPSRGAHRFEAAARQESRQVRVVCVQRRREAHVHSEEGLADRVARVATAVGCLGDVMLAELLEHRECVHLVGDATIDVEGQHAMTCGMLRNGFKRRKNIDLRGIRIQC